MGQNIRFALIVLVATVIWFLSGFLGTADDEDATQKIGQESSLSLVRAAWVESQNYVPQIQARGYTIPNRQVLLRAEIKGRVIAVPVEEGASVELGETICQLAAEDREQRVSEASAAVTQAEIEYQGALKLKQSGYQSKSAIAKAFAQLEAAKANFRRRQIDLENTAITASFAGIVDSRPVEVGDYVKVGDVCAELLEMHPLKIKAALSERELVQIQLGSRVVAQLVTGETVSGEVTYLSQLADPKTRTYRMEVVIPNQQGHLRAGVSARVLASASSLAAHQISAALLSLDDQGKLMVKALDDQDRVVNHQIELVGDDAEGVWLTGLPERVRLITVGYEYVSTGETVKAVMDPVATESDRDAP